MHYPTVAVHYNTTYRISESLVFIWCLSVHFSSIWPFYVFIFIFEKNSVKLSVFRPTKRHVVVLYVGCFLRNQFPVLRGGGKNYQRKNSSCGFFLLLITNYCVTNDFDVVNGGKSSIMISTHTPTLHGGRRGGGGNQENPWPHAGANMSQGTAPGLISAYYYTRDHGSTGRQREGAQMKRGALALEYPPPLFTSRVEKYREN